jgi:serine/threonine-protein kinase
VIALAAGIGAYWFGWARYTATPGVIGLSQKAATAKLEQAGLEVRIGDPAYSESVPKGRVLDTDPTPGARVLDNGTVTLTMSLGKERYAVPKVKGKSVDAAQDLLREAHLVYGRTLKKYDEVAPKGRVIGSDPKAGTKEPPGFQVDLIVSKGPRPIHIRDWTGVSADRAIRTLRARGLQVDAGSQEYSDTIAEGHVISQSPVGQVLHRGDTVTLVVSKGPHMVQVPTDLRGMGVRDARSALEDLGFHVEMKRTDFFVGLWYVVGSDPDPGSMAPYGSAVTIKIV